MYQHDYEQVKRTLPHNFGPLKQADANGRLTGSCGDTMEFWLRIQDGMVTEASFTTDGCADSIACGTAAANLVCGKGLSYFDKMIPEEVLAVAGDIPTESFHCALLSVDTLKKVVASYKEKNEKKPVSSCSIPKETQPSQAEEDAQIAGRLSTIKNKVVVLSGKGGVGKSTVAVHLAAGLALSGLRVGLLDVDFHGPSVPLMLGIKEQGLTSDGTAIVPVTIKRLNNLKVISMGFMLRHPDDAVIWRGPMKIGVIKQLIRDVGWGDLDMLVVDSPPGTGDEPLSVVQTLGKDTKALVVTTPQEASAADVRKSLNFCKQLSLDVIGIVENMSGFVCPHCGTKTDIFSSGGGETLAKQFDLPLLGSIPIEPDIRLDSDEGRTTFIEKEETVLSEIVEKVRNSLGLKKDESKEVNSNLVSKIKNFFVAKNQKENTMKIAIPVNNNKLNPHFGHCNAFAVMEVDMEKKIVISRTNLDAPPHQPGLLPKWLGDKGVNMIIAGGMGEMAQSLFKEKNIEVLVGCSPDTPENLANAFLKGELKAGVNACDH